MADPTSTQDVTIYSPDSARGVEVNVDNELLTHDQHAIEQLEAIASGTGIISQGVTTSWEYFANQGHAFTATYSAQFTGGISEQPFLLIRNPIGSGHYLKIKRLYLSIETNNTGSFRVYRHPTITAVGTPVFIEQVGIHGTDSGVGLVYSIPTYTATGGTMSKIDVNSGGVGSLVIEYDLAFIIKPGEDVLITLQQTANNNRFTADVFWAEEGIMP